MKKYKEYQLSKKINESSSSYKDDESKRLLSVGASPNKLDCILRNILEEYGHKIRSAHSHYEALTCLSLEPSSIILLNVADMKPCEMEASHNHATQVQAPILYFKELQDKKRDFRSYYNDVS